MRKIHSLSSNVNVIVLALVLAAGVSAQSVIDGSAIAKDVELHYKVFGSKGDYILLLSGGPGSSVDYMRPIAEALSNEYRCVLLEQRGTGRSKLNPISSETVSMPRYVEDVETVRRKLNADKVILIGNSWGMMLGLMYGGTYPDRVSKIITVGSGPISDKYAAIADDNFRVRLSPAEKELRSQWRDRLRKDPSLLVTANLELDRIATPAYYYDRERALKAARDLKAEDFNYYVVEEFFKGDVKFDLRPQLTRIKAPVLLIQGRQDLLPEENIFEAKKAITRSELRFIERCGHLPWEEKPDETFRLIREFLNRK